MAYSGWVASSDKPASTTTDGATDKISDARADLQKAIVALNKIVDIFQLEAEPTDNHILKYDQSAGKFATEADTAGSGASSIGVQDMWIPSTIMYPAGASQSPCGAHITIDTNQSSRVLPFDKDSVENAQFSIAMPKKWNEGTVTCNFYWAGVGSATGGVTWGIVGESLADTQGPGGGFSGTRVDVDDTKAASAAGYQQITSASAAITVHSAAEGEIVHFQISRQVGDSHDDLAEDAGLIGIMLHYTSDAENDA